MSCRRYLDYKLCLSFILFSLTSLQAQPQQAKHIYIAENDGVVYSHDGGKTFDMYDPKTTGIANDGAGAVIVHGRDIYVGTDKGLSISHDGGRHFVTRTTKDGLGDNVISSIYVQKKNIYVATPNGLGISHDNGKTFTNYTVRKDDLGSIGTRDVYVGKQGRIYVTTASDGPLYISDNNGKTFYRVKPSVPKGQSITFGPGSGGALYIVGNTIYVMTDAGLYVSHDGGKTLISSKIGRHALTTYVKGKNIYIVLDKLILISHDGGKTFIRRKIPKDSIGRMMALGQDIYGVGGCGYVVSHDDGKTFEHKMNNYQFKITSITPCIERYNATNDVFLTS